MQSEYLARLNQTVRITLTDNYYIYIYTYMYIQTVVCCYFRVKLLSKIKPCKTSSEMCIYIMIGETHVCKLSIIKPLIYIYIYMVIETIPSCYFYIYS